MDEYFNRAQLLCADILMNKEKYKPAMALVEKVLEVNKSCLLAYEYLIILTEK